MFKKEKCPNCGKKISKENNFCPYCGRPLKNSKKDWGMLGKNDFMEEQDPLEKSLFGGLTGGMFNKILGSTMKMLEREMSKIQDDNVNTKSNFELFINGKRINPKNINVSQKQPKKRPKIKSIELPSRKLKDFSKLPQETPETNVRRLSDKIIYEIKIPGVGSVKDISIAHFNDNIEIKAVSKTKAYFKAIQLALPVINYFLRKGKLILEFDAGN